MSITEMKSAIYQKIEEADIDILETVMEILENSDRKSFTVSAEEMAELYRRRARGISGEAKMHKLSDIIDEINGERKLHNDTV